MKAMIFAAGIGSRLKPWTDEHPKALVEIGGKPILQHVIERLKTVGVTDIAINVHHFADQIEDFLRRKACFNLNLYISDERNQLLDTGGGLLKASPFLNGDEPIIVYNADILSNVDLGSLIETHAITGADATLLVSARNSSRALLFDPDMRLMGWKNMSTGETIPKVIDSELHLTTLAFSGIQVISPRMLEVLAAQCHLEPFSIIPFYANAASELDLRGYASPYPYHWYDVGKPETLAAARNHWDEVMLQK